MLINYEGSSEHLLRQYILRAGCQAVNLATSANESDWSNELHNSDLVFLHLASPEETVRPWLAARLERQPRLIITSPFPKYQFVDLFVQPFAFLTEPFSYTQLTRYVLTYT